MSDLPENDYQYSGYHKRQCCNECGWFPKPIFNSFLVCYEGFERECCPDCGSEELSPQIGRLVFRKFRDGSWFNRYDRTVYIQFDRKDAES